MDDLISRQAAIDTAMNDSLIINAMDSVKDGDIHRTKRAIVRLLASLPSIDAVPAVRCKDCKHRYHSVECPCQSYDHFYSWIPADDWFCKKGERKES